MANTMTVQELIDRLQEIEDKSQKVWVYSYDDYSRPSMVIDHDKETNGVLII